METVVDALALPPKAMVRQRIPKKVLLEQGLPTAADKRAVQDGLEELWWVAALKPATCGLAAYTDAERDYAEVAVLALLLRPAAKATRLVELVHRAIPYPVVLLAHAGKDCTLTLATKRAHQTEKARWVVDEVRSTPALTESDALLPAMALHAQGVKDLRTLYERWLAQVEAAQAATITGRFRVPKNAEEHLQLREALEKVSALERELVQLRAKAKREKQMNRAVKLNLAIKSVERKLTRIMNDELLRN
ncbi:MAG: DUF4391 domain-containing protein [Flavobacteriales bacterium]|nr:DUF4391 domain-containing protein [Flavobacteriales bacterium]